MVSRDYDRALDRAGDALKWLAKARWTDNDDLRRSWEHYAAGLCAEAADILELSADDPERKEALALMHRAARYLVRSP